MSTDFSRVPVLEITRRNAEATSAQLKSWLQKADLVSLDCELSGLGNSNVDDRFAFLRELARSRAILSLGIGCFQHTTSHHYNVKVFNLILMSDREYTVDPKSVEFLVQHGFDFNMQYSQGISYTSQRYKTQASSGSDTNIVEDAFRELILLEKPVVFHNALIDLAFLYESFYAPLPHKLSTFLFDLNEMFPGGIFDTKYVSEFWARDGASFLQYLFRKSQRENHQAHASGASCATISLDESGDGVVHVDCCLPLSFETKSDKKLCLDYANHGFCRLGAACPNEHDVDMALDQEEEKSEAKREKKRKKRKRKMNAEGKADGIEDTDADTTKVEKSQPVETVPHKEKERVEVVKGSGHRSGFDAFMTGFCLITYVRKMMMQQEEEKEEGEKKEKELDWEILRKEWGNKVSLSGKSVPLTVGSSHFGRTSAEHQRKIALIRGSKID